MAIYLLVVYVSLSWATCGTDFYLFKHLAGLSRFRLTQTTQIIQIIRLIGSKSVEPELTVCIFVLF